MILPCTLPPDIIYANMKNAESGRDVTAELNCRANFGRFWPVK